MPPPLRAAAAGRPPAASRPPALAGEARQAPRLWEWARTRRRPNLDPLEQDGAARYELLVGRKQRRTARWASRQSASARRVLRRIVGWYVAEAAGSFRKARYFFRGLFLGVLASKAKKHRTTWAHQSFALGREDESPEAADAEEKPAVLTDEICLIPGDAPVVRVEDAPGNARRIFTGVDIRASVEEVWSVMTDYEGLQKVVPNLVHNQVLKTTEGGGARLWQIGRASWQILGRSFYFQAGTTLDVRLFPEGIPEGSIAGDKRDASKLSSAEARAMGKDMKLVRDVFPRPFSISADTVPVHDITMQNVTGEKGDFVHYQGVWRLQPLDACAPPGQDMMRLTFAVECEPHWFLPVAPVEGRIANALVENMEAIREHVEEQHTLRHTAGGGAASKEPGSGSSEGSAPQASASSSSSHGGAALDGLGDLAAGIVAAAEEALQAASDAADAALQAVLPQDSQGPSAAAKEPAATGGAAPAAETPPTQLAAVSSSAPGSRVVSGLRPRGSGRLAGVARGLRSGARAGRPPRVVATRAVPEVAELVEAMTETLERAEVGAAAEPATTAFLGTLAETAASIEAEQLIAASLAAGLAAVASGTVAPKFLEERDAQLAKQAEEEQGDTVLCRAWLAVCKQHPGSVREGHFLGVPFARKDVEHRWPRFVQVLGVSEEQALEIIENDATPLLVEPGDVAEVLSRLAAISSREKALELVGWNPALLVGGVPALKEGKDPGVSILVDVLYAGRLYKVLEEAGRDTAEKLNEIELYSYAMTGLKPVLDFFQKGGLTSTTMRLCRRPIEIAAQVAPNKAISVFLSRLAAVPDPWGFLVDQAKAGLFMTSSLAMRPSLATTIMPYSPSILPHLPSIYTRLSILRPHVPGIARILDPYFSVVEPHLDRIMERMDQIEPHLPYILINLDVLAKHCGPLLDHFDELIPYAYSKAEIGSAFEKWRACYEEADGKRLSADTIAECVIENWDEFEERPDHEIQRETEEVYYLPSLLPYVDFLVPRLDILAPHLPLVHPHLPHILPYLDRLLPYIPLFSAYPKASRNADVLVGYLGWMLKIPILPRVLYIPIVPRIIADLSEVLPRRLIRPVLERRRRREEAAAKLDKSTESASKVARLFRMLKARA